jgi:primosomal protein N' (replication factor Y)
MQAILFLNRRGFAPFLLCQQCGNVPKCKHCDVSLTYHKTAHQLSCHYCGFAQRPPSNCSLCGSPQITFEKFGTQKIEDDLALLVPNARIARLDLDTTRNRTAYEKIITSFSSGAHNVLVGTQMVTKGLDFANVSLVGIMDADQLLNYPDFRSAERALQLFSQVAGRAGRRHKQGQVYIQTYQPGNPVVRHVVRHEYNAFYNEQLHERSQFAYPPFTRLVTIYVKHKDPNSAHTAATTLASWLNQRLAGHLLGPEPCLVPRVKNTYQYQIMLKLTAQMPLAAVKEFIAQMLQKIVSKEYFPALLAYPDVDPY